MNSSTRSAAEGQMAPVKISHVVLRSPRYQEAIDWWKRFLGAHAQFESDFITFLTYDEEHHRLAIVNTPDAKARSDKAAGVDHFAFGYADLGQLVTTYERLKEQGVLPYWCINHGPTTSLYYKDPDGNQVEIQVENFPTLEECAAWFHTEAFRKNPIGIEFDADLLAKKFHDGTLVEELLKQGSVPAS